MKKIYRVSWSIWVKSGHEEFNSESKEVFFEDKTDAEDFKKKLEDANRLLGFRASLAPYVAELSLK